MLKKEFDVVLNDTYLKEFTTKIQETTNVGNIALLSKERDIDITLFLILN